jgi:hypothetical protein
MMPMPKGGYHCIINSLGHQYFTNDMHFFPF